MGERHADMATAAAGMSTGTPAKMPVTPTRTPKRTPSSSSRASMAGGSTTPASSPPRTHAALPQVTPPRRSRASTSTQSRGASAAAYASAIDADPRWRSAPMSTYFHSDLLSSGSGSSTPVPQFAARVPLSPTSSWQAPAASASARRPSQQSISRSRPHASSNASIRRPSIDARHDRSDHVHRNPSVTLGRRPSVVTGGYESSSDNDDTTEVDESEADDLDGLNVFVRNRHGHGHASHGNNGGNDGNGNSNNNSNNARPAASARHQSLDDYAIETSHDGQPSGSHVSASPQTHASHTNHGHNNHGHSHSPSHAQLQPQAPSRWHSIGSGNARSTVRHRSPTAPGPAPPQPSMGTAGAGFAGSGAATSSVSGISPSTLQGLGIMSSEHHSSSLNNTTAAANGRRRAQSLMSPVDNTPSTPSSARRSRFRPALGSPLSARRVSSSSGIPSNNGLLPSPLSSRKASDSHLHSRAGSTRSIGTVHEQQQFDPRLNGNGNGHGHGQGRAPSREGSIRQQQQQQQHQQQRDSPAARKQRAFGNSLGLGAAPREAALSPDQIQDLLADFDVSIAIQRMNAPIATRRVSTIQPAHTPRDRSPSRHASAEAPPKAGAAAGTPAEESPQPFTKPYLVSAPPALTSGDWHGRDRTVSVSSSIAPTRTFSPQSSLLRPPSASFDAESEERERAANAVGFTAHGVSPIPAVDSEAENENADPFGFERAVTAADTSAAAQPPPLSASTRADSKSSMPVSRPIPTLVDSTASAASAASAATAATVATTALASSTATQSPAKTDKDKDGGRRRISGLFGLRRSKHGVSSPAPTPAPSTPPPAAPAQLLKSSASPAPTPPRLTREQEMRIAEQERRGQEMVQERMERATMQVRTHPASQKRAQAAALTLDHCYGAIYDSLEHPPKFNPLAVLRWSRRVEEQRAAKAKWEAEQDIAHSESYSTGPSLSSPSDAVSPLGSRSVSSVPENFVALGWRYRLSDVTAYMACGGKVNFFIPPIEMLPAETPSVVSPAAVSHDERTERTDLLEPPPNIPVQDPARTRVTRSPDAPSPSGYQPAYQPSPSIIRPASTNDLRPRVSLTSSAGEWDAFPSDRAHPQPPSQLSPASPVIVAELLDEANMPSLSRSPSFEGGRPLRAHRSHQNTGSSLHALKEKLGSVARRNISMSVSPQPHDDDELPRRPGWLVADAPPPGAPGSSSQTDLNSALSSQQHTFRDRVRNRLSHVASAGNARLDGTRGDAREAGTGTSEDESGGHFRKLFRGASRQRGSHQHTDSSSRVEQMRALENIVGSERQMRYESTANRHPSERERQAQEGLLLLENQIYEERSALLQLACQRLDDLTATEYQMNKLITHFIATTDQAQATFKNAADVSIKFENIDHLRPTAKITPLAADDESADSVAPLRGEESDRGGFSAGGGFSDRGGSRSAVATRARRRSSLGLATAPLPSLNYVYAAGSRRLIVDPSLGVAFDPIQRVELGCERAREAMVDMSIAREESRRKLGAMVQSINMLIAQKDRVRVWARSTLEEAERLKEERDTIRLRIRGGIRPRLARLADESIDMAARGVLGLMSGGFRLYRMALGRSDSSWIGAVVVLAFGAALLAYFYMTGDPVEAAEAVGAAVDTVVSGDAAAAAAVGAVTDAVVEAV